MINHQLKEKNPQKKVCKNITISNNNTTIIINNINRNLTSEEIYLILINKIFSNQRRFNKIFTVKKKGKNKNQGICLINFFHSIDVYYLYEVLQNNNYLNKKGKKCEIFWARIQGDDFINEMNERMKQDMSLDFKIFSNNDINQE